MRERPFSAYAETDCHVDVSPPVVIRSGARNPASDALLAAHGVAAAAFLTAWNPASRPAPTVAKAAAQAELADAVVAEGRVALAGRGVGRDGTWPPEESLLVLGIDRAAAECLSRRFGQNVFVWIVTGAAAELIRTDT